MSTFNPESFLHTETTGEMSTKVLPVPVGEYRATIVDVKGRTTGDYTVMDVQWRVDDQDVCNELGRDVVRVKQSIFLDITPNGSLDLSSGKNIGLGRLRDAVGQNTPAPWTPAMLIGQQAIVKVEHRINGEDTYDEVKKVRPLE